MSEQPSLETRSAGNSSSHGDVDCDESGIPDDISLSPLLPAVQPNGPFPKRIYSGKLRSFNSSWYKEYPWIEYSKSKDVIYCYPCRHFTITTGNAEKAFTEVGFHDWKHACGKQGVLVNHNKCIVHKNAMVAWEDYKRNIACGTSVANQLVVGRELQIKNNRHYLISVAQVLLLCSHQEIALRGHCESEDSDNRGNFLELLHLLGKHDTVVMEYVKEGPPMQHIHHSKFKIRF